MKKVQRLHGSGFFVYTKSLRYSPPLNGNIFRYECMELRMYTSKSCGVKKYQGISNMDKMFIKPISGPLRIPQMLVSLRGKKIKLRELPKALTTTLFYNGEHG